MVSPLLAKAAPEGREIVNVTPERAGWTHVGFRALRLAATWPAGNSAKFNPTLISENHDGEMAP